MFAYCGNNPDIWSNEFGYHSVRCTDVELTEIIQISKDYSYNHIFDSEISKDCSYNSFAFAKTKPNFTPTKNKRKGSETRQPTGDRERNVGHPNAEEHSRVPKGTPRRSPSFHIEAETVLVGVGTVAIGYIVYRGIRMIPSLLPPLWWTIPINVAVP